MKGNEPHLSSVPGLSNLELPPKTILEIEVVEEYKKVYTVTQKMLHVTYQQLWFGYQFSLNVFLFRPSKRLCMLLMSLPYMENTWQNCLIRKGIHPDNIRT